MMTFTRDKLTDLLLLVAGIVAGLPSNSQQPDFFHITVEERLSNRSVLSITEDSSGFLWAGTEMLLQQLSTVIKLINTNAVTSVCGNQFYKQTFRDAFNV